MARESRPRRTAGSSFAQLVGSKHPEIADAVGFGLLLVPEARRSRLVAGDDHLADAAVRDVVLGAVAVEHFACPATHRRALSEPVG